MTPISYQDLIAFIRSHQREKYRTLSDGKEFNALIVDSGLKCVQCSNGDTIIYPDNTIKQVIKKFQENNSFDLDDYKDISKDVFYLIAVINEYIQSDAINKSQHLIESLYIGNFKAFAGTQKIPIKPITLIYGANSAGKSSIIHSLVLAKHAMETGELDVHETQISGNIVDLGGFVQYIHRHYSLGRVIWSIGINTSCLPEYLSSILAPSKQLIIKLTIGSGYTDITVPRFGEEDPSWPMANIPLDLHRKGDMLFTRPRRITVGGNCNIESIEMVIDERVFLSMSLREDGELKAESWSPHSHMLSAINALLIFRGLSEKEIKDISKKEKQYFKIINEAITNISTSVDYWLPEKIIFPKEFHKELSQRRISDLIATIKDTSDITNYLKLFPAVFYNEVFKVTHELISSELKGIHYLGPLRSLPPRHLSYENRSDPNWIAGGGQVWEILRRDSIVRDNVNKWLGKNDGSQIPYSLIIREYVPINDRTIDELATLLNEELSEFIFNNFIDSQQEEHNKTSEDSLMGISRTNREKISKSKKKDNQDLKQLAFDCICEWIRKNNESHGLARSLLDRLIGFGEDLQDINLIDKRSGTTVSHRDVGIGISQVLPVLTLAYGIEGQIIAIEQPELHLHPRLQAELGDLFIDSALGKRRNTFLLESHSEHLLLRIMRRMRETFEGNLPDGIPPITPDDVAVLFVEPDGAHSIVREMPLNERGELIKAWPGGFFEEGLREVFPEDAS